MKRVRFSSMGPPESDLVSQDCEQPCLTSLLLSPPTQPTLTQPRKSVSVWLFICL